MRGRNQRLPTQTKEAAVSWRDEVRVLWRCPAPWWRRVIYVMRHLLWWGRPFRWRRFWRNLLWAVARLSDIVKIKLSRVEPFLFRGILISIIGLLVGTVWAQGCQHLGNRDLDICQPLTSQHKMIYQALLALSNVETRVIFSGIGLLVTWLQWRTSSLRERQEALWRTLQERFQAQGFLTTDLLLAWIRSGLPADESRLPGITHSERWREALARALDQKELWLEPASLEELRCFVSRAVQLFPEQEIWDIWAFLLSREYCECWKKKEPKTGDVQGASLKPNRHPHKLAGRKVRGGSAWIEPSPEYCRKEQKVKENDQEKVKQAKREHLGDRIKSLIDPQKPCRWTLQVHALKYLGPQEKEWQNNVQSWLFLDERLTSIILPDYRRAPNWFPEHTLLWQMVMERGTRKIAQEASRRALLFADIEDPRVFVEFRKDHEHHKGEANREGHTNRESLLLKIYEFPEGWPLDRPQPPSLAAFYSAEAWDRKVFLVLLAHAFQADFSEKYRFPVLWTAPQIDRNGLLTSLADSWLFLLLWNPWTYITLLPARKQQLLALFARVYGTVEEIRARQWFWLNSLRSPSIEQWEGEKFFAERFREDLRLFFAQEQSRLTDLPAETLRGWLRLRPAGTEETWFVIAPDLYGPVGLDTEGLRQIPHSLLAQEGIHLWAVLPPDLAQRWEETFKMRAQRIFWRPSALQEIWAKRVFWALAGTVSRRVPPSERVLARDEASREALRQAVERAIAYSYGSLGRFLRLLEPAVANILEREN